jgi:hypothetical protein
MILGLIGRQELRFKHNIIEFIKGEKAMNSATLRLKLIEELQYIPEEKIPQLYDIICFFRAKIESVKPASNNIMSFAGCWEDMPDEMFNSLLNEVAERRTNAFSGRRQHETLIN